MTTLSIGEELAAMYRDGLLTYEQVWRLADTCGSLYDQWPEPGCEGWENPAEEPPAPHVMFTSYWQFTDYSFMEQWDTNPKYLGHPPNGHVFLRFDETPEQRADTTATVLHIINRIKEGEPAEALVPKARPRASATSA